MSEEFKVEITKKEYESLLRDRDILAALESGGVDNWEWYGESLAPLLEKWEESDES
jgi:hypothetical protein